VALGVGSAMLLVLFLILDIRALSIVLISSIVTLSFSGDVGDVAQEEQG
jgi:hypothetical protein